MNYWTNTPTNTSWPIHFADGSNGPQILFGIMLQMNGKRFEPNERSVYLQFEQYFDKRPSIIVNYTTCDKANKTIKEFEME